MEVDGKPAKKRTRIATNCSELVQALRQLQCPGNHEHAKLLGGKSRQCQVYPELFCKIVCEAAWRDKEKEENETKRTAADPGVKKESNVITALNTLGLTDGSSIRDVTKELGAINEGPHDPEAMYEEYYFIEDTTGQQLDHRLAKEARKLEMDFFRKMKVYEKVPRWHAQRDKCKVITTKWIDVNKGDDAAPNYRARLVGRELKLDNRLDLFAATPPLEALKALCSICASRQDGSDPHRLMSIDVKRAYFYARVQRPVYIEIPIEDLEYGDETKIGKLNLSLYGTRDAAQNWMREYSSLLKSLGFIAGLASPCNFRHGTRDIVLTVHGDDFTVTGSNLNLRWLETKMKEKYEIKCEMLGPEPGMKKELRILNRIIRWADGGIEYEADQRHAEIIIEEMGATSAKPVNTAAVTEPGNVAEVRAGSNKLTSRDATKYRALAARLNFLSMDRADLQYAAKSVARHMSAPHDYDWIALKRVARYLRGAPRAVQMFCWQQAPSHIDTCTDSDWAGDKVTRKSTSGGTVMVGAHMLKTWSSTQQVVATSSGEAELYAMVKGASQTKGMMAMMSDFGIQLAGRVQTDASAAIGMVHRQGLGKTKHIEVQYLWVQQEVQEERLQVKKIHTSSNPADMFTKPVPEEVVRRHLRKLGVYLSRDRAQSAPRLTRNNKSGAG